MRRSSFLVYKFSSLHRFAFRRLLFGTISVLNVFKAARLGFELLQLEGGTHAENARYGVMRRSEDARRLDGNSALSL
jgi:hypothetical protein